MPGKKAKEGQLGRALRRDRFSNQNKQAAGGTLGAENTSARHTVEILRAPESGDAGHSARQKQLRARNEAMMSMTDTNTSTGIEDFLLEAELQGRKFEAENPHAVVISGPLAVDALSAKSTVGGRLNDGTGPASSVVSQNGPGRPLIPGNVRFKLATSSADGPVIAKPVEVGPREQLWNEIRVPRRPEWDKSTTRDELHRREEASFLEWRRGLAQLEEAKGVLLTPYEKNINVWRQLWRVVERSDVLVQIVDARNPKLFRCPDLEEYVREVGAQVSGKKANLLVVNKADLLSSHERESWMEYFREQKVDFVFFSASEEQLAVELKLHSELAEQNLGGLSDASSPRSGSSSDEEEDSDDTSDLAVPSINASDKDEEFLPNKSGTASSPSSEDQVAMNTAAVLNRNQLLSLIQRQYQNLADVNRPSNAPHTGVDTERLIVGFVGYPNVGKSSTINVLMQDKLVSVAATPGKTKHFQTLLLDDDSIDAGSSASLDTQEAGKIRSGVHITLCDCPGLVFPTHLTTKAAMVCNGLLPIDHMREFRPQVELLVEWIPRRVLEDVYSLHLPVPPEIEAAAAQQLVAEQASGLYGVDTLPKATAAEFLQTYAALRSFRTVHGAPDESRAARIVLKDLLNGKLVYVHAPPGYPGGKFAVNHTALDIAKQERNAKQRSRAQEAYQELYRTNAPSTVAAAALGQLDSAEAAALLHTPQRKVNMLKSPLDRAMHRKHARLLKKGAGEEEASGVMIAGQGRKLQKGRKGKRRTDVTAGDFFQRQQAVGAFAQSRKKEESDSFTRAF